MQTIKQLLEQVDNDSLFMVIKEEYPAEWKRIESGYYDNLIERIKEAQETENELDRTVHVEYSKDFGKRNSNYLWNASYSTEKRYHCKYSLKYLSIEEVSSSYVRKNDLEKLSIEKYFAHLLYELAYRDVLLDDGVKSAENPSTKDNMKNYVKVEDVLNIEIEE